MRHGTDPPGVEGSTRDVGLEQADLGYARKGGVSYQEPDIGRAGIAGGMMVRGRQHLPHPV
jgi:hypothetical protein